ncbi:hypothetical protein [Rhizobium sp. BK251]|uniref:hypothetical protein n=1 Tax=Rhizobium sp. BK251 TaxID=2512125 RepID=UPI001044C4FE|nr:hypothetical protein [Rhizobium sp. BK251]
MKGYSRGLVSQREAVRQLKLRDTSDLLVALGDAGLSMPMPTEEELREQAATFASLWRLLR